MAEIATQPEAMRRAASALRTAAAVLDRLPPANDVMFTGMGASYDACYPAATALSSAGRRCAMVDASELLHFRLAALRHDDLVVAVSQSGSSAETVALVERLRGDACPRVLAVTNGPESALARAADLVVDIGVGEELGPSTMTFAGTLVALSAIAKRLGGASAAEAADDAAGNADRAARAAERLLEDVDAMASLARRWLGERRTLILVGRGGARAAAETGSLVLKEAARLPAEAQGAGQFRHGPIELAGADLAVAIVSTEGETAALDAGLARDLVAAGASVMVIGSTDGAPSESVAVPIEPLDRTIAPAVAVIPFQLLAWRVAVERGLDPGMLSIATKVTTRE